MCFDRRGRFSPRRLLAGLFGIVISFVFSAIFAFFVFAEPSTDLFKQKPFPGRDQFSVRCHVAIGGNYTEDDVLEEIVVIRKTWGRDCSSLQFSRSYGSDVWGAWKTAIDQAAAATGHPDDWTVLTGLGTYLLMGNLKKMVQSYVHSDTSHTVWAQEINTNKQPVADSRDEQLQHRMLPFPMRHLIRTTGYRFPDDLTMRRQLQPGVECCSPRLVSVASLDWRQIHLYDFLLQQKD